MRLASLYILARARLYTGISVDEKTLERAELAPVESPPVRVQEPMLYCPVCSRRLAERKCKLFCEQCGYYMSCADYY